ncbi:MAG: hypothetical protein H9W81_13925 [Enterococcus sp.]|nr:hypothetical protein [Enterococcus sp.]
MEFKEILMYAGPNTVIITMIFLFLLIPLLVFYTVASGANVFTGRATRLGKIGFFLLLIAFTLVLSFGPKTVINASHIPAQNEEALISNIQHKYDVDEVKLEAYGEYTRPEDVDEQKIHVVVEGETYMFYLSQDRQTWEPTLLDPPVNGGNQQNVSPLKASELLK